jgi:hypothetical protein
VRRLCLVTAALILTAATTSTVHAQSGPPDEGAPEFVLPIGPRTTAMGLTGVTSSRGSESPWWNPSLVARAPRDASLGVQSKVTAAAEADLAGVVVYPLPPDGSVAQFARHLGYGEQDAFDKNNQLSGTFTTSNTIVGVTFASTFARYVAAGFSIKTLLISFNCSGSCPQLPSSRQDAALDFGGHAYLTKDSTLAFGATVRNIGPKLQIQDSPQADPLPARADMGISYSPKLPNAKDVEVTGAADVITRISGGTAPGFRAGGELTYQHKYSVRAGYVVNGPSDVLEGATFGLGIISGKLTIDFAQMLTNAQAASDRPTLISLRYTF